MTRAITPEMPTTPPMPVPEAAQLILGGQSATLQDATTSPNPGPTLTFTLPIRPMAREQSMEYPTTPTFTLPVRSIANNL